MTLVAPVKSVSANFSTGMSLDSFDCSFVGGLKISMIEAIMKSVYFCRSASLSCTTIFSTRSRYATSETEMFALNAYSSSRFLSWVYCLAQK